MNWLSFITKKYAIIYSDINCMYQCLQRLAISDCVADHWFDYGAFSLLVEKNDMAEQCFYEAISLDQTHIPRFVGNIAECK